MLEHYWW